MQPLPDDAQTSLYQERRKIKYSVRPFKLERHHWEYIQNYLKKNKSSLLFLAGLMFSQVLIEVLALLFINSTTRGQIYGLVQNKAVLSFTVIIIIGAALYLAITYLSIKYERKAVLGLINDLRRKLFSGILQKQQKMVTNEAKADFIAKMSYHLPLLNLGLDHSVFGSIRWVFSASILVALALVANTNIIYFVLIAIAFSILIGFIAYCIARYYISQEVASYSQVIRHITLTLTEFPSIKSLHKEQSALEELDAKVAIDTYFRIRRDIWLRYFNRVLFTLLFIASISSFAFAFSNPEKFSFFYNPASNVITGIISLYLIRLFYEAVQTGLYIPPVKLGIFLSVPIHTHQNFKRRMRSIWKTIAFKSNKTKLFPEGEYFKNLSLEIKRDGRYLFTGIARSGKTNLAYVFAGSPEFNQDGWLVKIDEQRFDYRHWINSFDDRYFFAPQFHSEKTLGELILGKDRQDIVEEDISKVYALCEKYPLLYVPLSKKRFLGDSAKAFENNAAALFIIQTLFCIVNETSFVIIDNHWIDLGYGEIEESIRILDKELPNSAIVVCSREKNDIIKYGSIYEIKKDHIA